MSKELVNDFGLDEKLAEKIAFNEEYKLLKIYGALSNTNVINTLPKDWTVINWNQIKFGCVWCSNNKSLFGNERKTALLYIDDKEEQFIATNINYDTDGEEEFAKTLPQNIDVTNVVKECREEGIRDKDGVEGRMLEYISNKIGYRVTYFNVEKRYI